MRIVVLTGADVSAQSGPDTFRDKDGLWTKVDLDEVATPKGYRRNPSLVLDFYNMRRQGVVAAQPNAAHRALARLEERVRDRLALVTQNVDDFHERANRSCSRRCARPANTRWPWHRPMSVEHACRGRSAPEHVRPDVVLSCEVPFP
jgi:NAD-dependent deacetylase